MLLLLHMKRAIIEGDDGGFLAAFWVLVGLFFAIFMLICCFVIKIVLGTL